MTREVFASGQIAYQLDIVIDGEEAIQFLHKKGKYADAKTPDLILLDLNMPRKDGFEVLKLRSEDATLARIPVMILSTSNNESDIQKCYDMGADYYFIKPVDLDNFYEVIKLIEDFWQKKKPLSTLPK